MEYSEQEWSDLKQTISLVFVVFFVDTIFKERLNHTCNSVCVQNRVFDLF